MIIAPVTALVLFVVGGIGSVAGFIAFQQAEKAGNSLTITDLLPASPFQGPPVPRGVLIKPEAFKALVRGKE